MDESGGVRKSTRARKRQSYLEDDFEYDLSDAELDVSKTLNIQGIKSPKKAQTTEKVQSPKRVNSAWRKKSTEIGGLKSKRGEKTGKAGLSKSDNSGDNYSLFVKTENLTCTLCHRYLATEKELEAHIDEHRQAESETGALKCDICEKVCQNSLAYNKHMKSHTAERPFQCDYCGKAFIESFGLRRHLKVHADIRPFVCEICFKSFRDSTGFARHQKIHANLERAFKCASCDKSFKDKQGLKRHEKTHTGHRPFECNVCGKTFIESGSFRRHEKIHTGLRKFSCWRCERRFLEKQSLVRHLKHVCGFGDGSFDAVEESKIDHYNDLNVNELNGMNNYISEDTKSGKVDPSIYGNEDFQPLETPIVANHLGALFSHHAMSGKGSKEEQCNDQLNQYASTLPGSPSLRTLINKDPNLIDGISEIVDSIDSYEKMLDLCGDKGQTEIDAALTRAPESTTESDGFPFPDNLVCFECGELLVDGDNFNSEGKTHMPNVNHSFKCLACEDDDSLADMPGLTAEVSFQMDNDSSDNKQHVNEVNEEGEHFESNDNNNSGDVKDTNCPDFVSPYFKNGSCVKEEVKAITADNEERASNHSRADTTAVCDHTLNVKPELWNKAQGSSLTSRKNLLPAQSDTSIDSTLASSNSIYIHQMQQQPDVHCLDYEIADPNIPTVFPCHRCSKVFTTAAFLKQHLKLHKALPFKCEFCTKGFSNLSGLKRHKRVHTGEKPYACTLCSKQFRDPSNYSKHKKLCIGPCHQKTSQSTDTNTLLVDASSKPQNSVTERPSVNKASLRMSIHLSATGGNWTSMKSESMDQEAEDGSDRRHNSPEQHADKFAQSLNGDEEEVEEEISSFTPSTSPPTSNVTNDENSSSFENYIECEICCKVCSSQSLLEQHMNFHKGDPEKTCIECGKAFSDAFNLKRHMRIHADIRPHKCEYCGRGYCDNWSFKKHQTRGCHKDELQIQADLLHPCSECNRAFVEQKYLIEHSKSHRGELSFECDICGKMFSEAFNLKRHRRLHLAVCPMCNEEFPDAESLSAHQANSCKVSNSDVHQTTDGNKFACSVCGRAYSTKANLDRHKKFHGESKIKTHSCDTCGKKFTEAFRLRRHMKVHSGKKPYVCQTCWKGFNDPISLRRHMSVSCKIGPRVKKKVIDFPCQLCDKVFAKKHLLVRHMNVHSQERPYECEQCGRTYKDTSSLRRHQLVHEGIKEHICPRCGKDFYYSDSLRRHMEGNCEWRKKKKAKGGR